MKHKKVKQNEYYKLEGEEIKRLKKVCNRCGDGTFMAEHKDRWYCGKCGMTIWKKKTEKKKEEKKQKAPEELDASKKLEKAKESEKTDELDKKNSQKKTEEEDKKKS